jgi:anaerobic carbon-monoxide dehydrogenase iron sulfur subunit
MRLAIADAERCIGCQCCMFACSRRQNEAGLSNACLEVKSAGGFERGFTIIVCRACEDPPCAKVCPTGALSLRQGGGVRLTPEKCIGCNHCRQACLIGAIFWNQDSNKPVICLHCGYCADYCPHNILKLEEKETAAHAVG